MFETKPFGTSCKSTRTCWCDCWSYSGFNVSNGGPQEPQFESICFLWPLSQWPRNNVKNKFGMQFWMSSAPWPSTAEIRGQNQLSGHASGPIVQWSPRPTPTDHGSTAECAIWGCNTLPRKAVRAQLPRPRTPRWCRACCNNYVRWWASSNPMLRSAWRCKRRSTPRRPWWWQSTKRWRFKRALRPIRRPRQAQRVHLHRQCHQVPIGVWWTRASTRKSCTSTWRQRRRHRWRKSFENVKLLPMWRTSTRTRWPEECQAFKECQLCQECPGDTVCQRSQYATVCQRSSECPGPKECQRHCVWLRLQEWLRHKECQQRWDRLQGQALQTFVDDPQDGCQGDVLRDYDGGYGDFDFEFVFLGWSRWPMGDSMRSSLLAFWCCSTSRTLSTTHQLGSWLWPLQEGHLGTSSSSASSSSTSPTLVEFALHLLVQLDSSQLCWPWKATNPGRSSSSRTPSSLASSCLHCRSSSRRSWPADLLWMALSMLWVEPEASSCNSSSTSTTWSRMAWL